MTKVVVKKDRMFCYLFAEHFDDDNCLSILLNFDGSVNEPLKTRTTEEFKLLQQAAKTFVVLPTSFSSIHELELPLLNTRKARQVISYALEEELSQVVTELHFVFDSQYYINNRYLVCVIDRNIIINLQNKLETLNINYDVITSDWFSLKQGDASVVGNNMLVNSIEFKGSLELDLIATHFNTITAPNVFVFNDSKNFNNLGEVIKTNLDSYVWVAAQLLKNKPMNFCQGEFQHNTDNIVVRRWYKISAALCLALIVSFLSTNLINLFVLNHLLSDYDKKIAVIYKSFFPNAKQIINPRFRVNQLLKDNRSGYNGVFWTLLNKFTINYSFMQSDIVVKELRFQNSSLLVKLTCNDFSSLEKLESNLKKDNVKVYNSGASTKGDKVEASLELSCKT